MITQIEQNTHGLRNILFEELQKLRSGKAVPGHTRAVVSLMNTILSTARLDLDYAKFQVQVGRKKLKDVEPVTLNGQKKRRAISR